MKESEGQRQKERRGWEGTVSEGRSGGEETVMWPMFSLAGVKEEDGQWQKVGRPRLSMELVYYSMCVCMRICAHVYLCVSVLHTRVCVHSHVR